MIDVPPRLVIGLIFSLLAFCAYDNRQKIIGLQYRLEVGRLIIAFIFIDVLKIYDSFWGSAGKK